MSKIVIISSSMRKGNSDKLCDQFEMGAKQAGNIVTRINIRQIKLNFCLACRDCYNIGDCVQKDSMNGLYRAIKDADILVFASPIYFGEMSGSLKTFFDRMYPLYTSISGKKVYIIASCYTNDKEYVNDSINGIKRCLDDFGLDLVDVIYGENTDEINDVTAKQLKIAYNIGKNIK